MHYLKPSQLAAVALSIALTSPQLWAQCEIQELSDDDSAGDVFGAVAIYDDVIVVGDPLAFDDQGALYVYRLNELQWELEAVLQSPTPSDTQNFGGRLAAGLNTIVAGAPGNAEPPGEPGGSVDVYGYVAAESMWRHEQRLVGSDVGIGERFGWSVDLDGDRIAVGVRDDAHSGAVDAGSAYVFVFKDGTWVEEAALYHPEPASADLFGASISIWEDLCIVGVPGEDPAQAGGAVVFRNGIEGWQAETILTPVRDPIGNERAGTSVSIHADVAVLGAYNELNSNGNQAGSVYVYRHARGRWIIEANLLASDGHPIAFFGTTVALGAGADAIVVGAPLDDEAGNRAGAVYLYDWLDGVWQERVKLTGKTTAPGDSFGWLLAVYGDWMVAGAPGQSRVDGSAHVFAGVLPKDCNANRVTDGCDIASGTSRDDDGDGVPDECVCESDVDGDTVVGIDDLTAVLLAWGNPGGDEDVNNDGIVDVDDLVQVILDWGPCFEP